MSVQNRDVREEFMWLEQGQQDLLGIGYDFPLFIALFNTRYDWYLEGINWAQNPEGHLVKTAAPILGKYATQLTEWGDSIPEGESRINFALNAAASCINGGYFTEADFFSGVYTLGWFYENWSVEAYTSVSLDIDRDYLLQHQPQFQESMFRLIVATWDSFDQIEDEYEHPFVINNDYSSLQDLRGETNGGPATPFDLVELHTALLGIDSLTGMLSRNLAEPFNKVQAEYHFLEEIPDQWKLLLEGAGFVSCRDFQKALSSWAPPGKSLRRTRVMNHSVSGFRSRAKKLRKKLISSFLRRSILTAASALL